MFLEQLVTTIARMWEDRWWWWPERTRRLFLISQWKQNFYYVLQFSLLHCSSRFALLVPLLDFSHSPEFTRQAASTNLIVPIASQPSSPLLPHRSTHKFHDLNDLSTWPAVMPFLLLLPSSRCCSKFQLDDEHHQSEGHKALLLINCYYHYYAAVPLWLSRLLANFNVLFRFYIKTFLPLTTKLPAPQNLILLLLHELE